jgi:hypothetical protein
LFAKKQVRLSDAAALGKGRVAEIIRVDAKTRRYMIAD